MDVLSSYSALDAFIVVYLCSQWAVQLYHHRLWGFRHLEALYHLLTKGNNMKNVFRVFSELMQCDCVLELLPEVEKNICKSFVARCLRGELCGFYIFCVSLSAGRRCVYADILTSPFVGSSSCASIDYSISSMGAPKHHQISWWKPARMASAC